MKLNQLSDNDGARKSRIRVGRGIGSGKGKTSASGQKGQKSRTGVAIKGFEGGQMPLYRRLPKRGFVNKWRKTYAEVNIGRIQTAIDNGKIDPANTLGVDELRSAGLIGHPRDGVRLLAQGEITASVTIQVAGASRKAVEMVEKAGGKVILPAGAKAEDA